MNAPTDWTTAVLILAAGLILGGLVLFAARRRKTTGAKRHELEQRLDSLVKQLRELGDDVVDEERAWLEKETAEILRALDQLPAPASPPTAATSKRSLAAAFALGVVCTLAVGAIVSYASQSASDKASAVPQMMRARNGQPEKTQAAMLAAMQPSEAMSRPALPPNHPPIPGSEVTMPPATEMASMPLATAGGGEPIHITLTLAPSLTQRGGTIYVIARGAEGGHPVAVRRINTNAFPVTLDFGASDSMMGSALPERVRIEARLDSDGDAGTNDPADLRASVDGVRAGATIELQLAQTH